jgi:hypothetical protein
MVNMFTKTLSRHRHQFMIDKLMFRFVIHQHQTLNLLKMKFYFFMKLSRSDDPGYRFNKLVGVELVFFSFFN